jgi:lysophospholipase L1-like esterase
MTRRSLLVAALGALISGSAPAMAAETCPGIEPHRIGDQPLPAAARQIAREKRLKLVTLGSSSTVGSGVTNPQAAWPARLAAEIMGNLPGVEVILVNKGRPRDTAGQMLDRLTADVLAERPGLVIWQTGTTDAVRRLDVDHYAWLISQGIERMRTAGIDVVLMDPQYSRASSMVINFPLFVEALERVADAHQVQLFSRYRIMRAWIGEGAISFDNLTRDQARQVADRVNDCLARALARSITEAIKAGKP